MSPYTKAARSAIRLIAAGFIVLGICLCSPDLFQWLYYHALPHIWVLLFKAIPFVIGLVINWKSDNIAKRLTKDLD